MNLLISYLLLETEGEMKFLDRADKLSFDWHENSSMNNKVDVVKVLMNSVLDLINQDQNKSYRRDFKGSSD